MEKGLLCRVGVLGAVLCRVGLLPRVGATLYGTL